jgi:hypothetical protein
VDVANMASENLRSRFYGAFRQADGRCDAMQLLFFKIDRWWGA